MKKIKVYLGGCKGDWREKVIEALPEFECYDPFEQSAQNSIVEYVRQDLEAIRNSDRIIFYIGYKVYNGACIEAGYAHALGIPIITIFTLKGRVDPLLIGISEKVYTDLEPAIRRLQSLYRTGK